MKAFNKYFGKTGLIVVVMIVLGIRNAMALIPLPVIDWPDLQQKALQTLQETLMSELESQCNQILSKKLTDLGFGEMAGNLFGPVLGPLLENNPYLQQLEGSLGVIENSAKDMAKGAGECVIQAKKARQDATKQAKSDCKEKNPEDKVAEKKCIEDAKTTIKKIEKDALKLCREDMNRRMAEISAEAKKDAKDLGDSMKKDYNQAVDKAKSVGNTVKNTFKWGKKSKKSDDSSNGE